MIKKIGILAGEASGDLLGAELIYALRERYPDVMIEGMGGPLMQAAGCQILFDSERLAVMGFIEPLLRLPDLIRLRREIYQHFTIHRPDLFIGIDAPDFNLGLERKLRAAGIPTVHYVSPSVWAWRQYRVHKIRKAVDLMLTLLPFEADFYKRHNVRVCYVGHPLADTIPLQPDTKAARHALGLDEQATYIALLPGSRQQELKYLAQPFLQAAALIHEQHPQIRFITAQANEKRCQQMREWQARVAPSLSLDYFVQRSQEVLAAADVVMVTSGTATLEAMLFKKPMVIAYRMSPMVFPLAKWLVKTPFIGLPNLLANELLVPELIQEALTPEALAQHVLHYLEHPEQVAALKQRFLALHQHLRSNAANKAVAAIAEMMGER